MTVPPFRALTGKRDTDEYLPSYELEGEFIDDAHRGAPDLARPLAGWLRDEDVLKLYELAYFASGPVLEVGTHRGKSTVVIATAVARAGSGVPVISLDIDAEAIADASETIAAHGLGDRVVLVRATAGRFLARVERLRPPLVFLDADHSHRGVAADLAVLRGCVPAGGLLLLHDYNDPRNDDPAEPDYGVSGAVAESWLADECEFAGVFGACGLFRRTSEPPGVTGTPIVDLGGEPARNWVARRVVGGLMRRGAQRRGS